MGSYIILGPSGSGKTRLLFELLRRRLNAGGKDVRLFVVASLGRLKRLESISNKACTVNVFKDETEGEFWSKIKNKPCFR